MDTENIGGMEVMRGPAGSLYGAGNGGVLLFKSDKAKQEGAYVGLSSVLGDFGLSRIVGTAAVADDNFNLKASYIQHNYDGYREQEFLYKDQLTVHVLIPKEESLYAVYATAYGGIWGLPGALNSAEVEDDPTQAVAFAKDADTFVRRRRGRVGVSRKHTFNKHWQWVIAAYGNITSKENPYGTSASFNGLKLESAQGGGLRSLITNQSDWAKAKLKNTLGTELQLESNTLREHENALGARGPLKIDATTRTSVQLIFMQTEIEIPGGWIFTGGLSYNFLSYSHSDALVDSIDYSGTRNFDPRLSPRLAILKGFGDIWAVHSSLSFGFSQPTLWELLRADGSFDRGLESELGVNYEAGVRGSFVKKKLVLDLIGFNFILNDVIIPEELPSGETIFVNRVSAQQQGIELFCSYDVMAKDRSMVTKLKPWLSLTYNDFEFKGNDIGDISYDGNRMTGVPEHMITAGLDLKLKNGLYLSGSIQQVGETPLNNTNLNFAEAYQLVLARIGYRRSVSEELDFELFVGGDNLLDAKYSSFLRLNGFGGRFYNPSPSRNFYGGIRLNYNLRKAN